MISRHFSSAFTCSIAKTSSANDFDDYVLRYNFNPASFGRFSLIYFEFVPFRLVFLLESQCVKLHFHYQRLFRKTVEIYLTCT